MLPSVFDYTDFRAYLAEWFAAKKESNPRYSHRAFVSKTGQRSPSMLTDVINGRRTLTSSGLDGFIRALSLTSSEARFFRCLVDFAQASSPDEKNAAWLDILASRRFRDARRLEGEGFRYLSTWYIPVIRELANREDFQANPIWVADQVVPAITEEEAERALSLLFELDLLVKEGDRVTHGGGSVVTPHEVAGLAVRNYHAGMLERARHALDETTSEQRHFLGVTVTVPPALVPELKKELNAMQERLLEQCAGSPEPANQVFQFNLHFFPLSNAGTP